MDAKKKEREAFDTWVKVVGLNSFGLHYETAKLAFIAGYEAALRTHENGGQESEAGAERLSEMNDALCDFALRWALNGDWLTCKFCKRNHIASKHNEEFVHAAGCKAKRPMEPKPWNALMDILRPLYTSLIGVPPLDSETESGEK